MGKALMALALAGLVAVGLAALAPGHAGVTDSGRRDRQRDRR